MNAEELKRHVDKACATCREYFPPDAIDWHNALIFTAIGGYAPCVPHLKIEALRERLDTAFGPENWKESYEALKKGALVTLAVRYSPGGDWITRVGLCLYDMTGDEYAGAIRDAARGHGIGAYLPRFAQSVEVVTDGKDGKKLAKEPTLPDCVMPHDYQRVNREAASKLRGIANQCSEESTKRGRTVTREAAAYGITRQWLKADASGHVNMMFLTNAQYAEALKIAHAWLEQLSKNITAGSPAIPLPDSYVAPGRKEDNSQKSAPTTGTPNRQ